MDFFGVGPMELLVVLLLGLVILGPSRMVDAARSMGRFVRQVRRATADVPQLFSLDDEEDTQARGRDAHRVKREGQEPGATENRGSQEQ